MLEKDVFRRSVQEAIIEPALKTVVGRTRGMKCYFPSMESPIDEPGAGTNSIRYFLGVMKCHIDHAPRTASPVEYPHGTGSIGHSFHLAIDADE